MSIPAETDTVKESSDTKHWGVGLIALLFKVGIKLIGIFAKLFKGATVTKVALAGASITAYSLMWSWEFALLIMISLFVHESGHVWAMRKCGVKTRGFYFIPFMGGAAISTERAGSRMAEAMIVIMGPLWGLSLAVFTMIVYLITHQPLWAAAAAWMGMINLFNLLPITPLDGGRLLNCMAFSMHSRLGLAFMAIAFVVIVFFAFVTGMGLFCFLALIGGVELYAEWQSKNGKTQRQRIRYHLNRLAHEVGGVWMRPPDMSFMNLIIGGGHASSKGMKVECDIPVIANGTHEHDSAQEDDSGSFLCTKDKVNTLFDDNKQPILIGITVDTPSNRGSPYICSLIADIDPPIREVTPLTGREIGVTMLCYGLMVILLWSVMYSMSHVPGADLALQFLND